MAYSITVGQSRQLKSIINYFSLSYFFKLTKQSGSKSNLFFKKLFKQISYWIIYPGKPMHGIIFHLTLNYTVEVRNRFKRLDLIERVPDELYGWRFMTLYRRQGSRLSPRKRNAKKQNGCLGRPYK